MSTPKKKKSKKNYSDAKPSLLRRLDQACLGFVLAVSLTAGGMLWCYQWAAEKQSIDIDRAQPQVVEFQLDVNKAQWPELTLLPGVGETIARRIVESRTEEGDFRDLQDLQRVRGVGPKTLDKMRPYLLPLPDSSAVAGP